MMYNIENFTFNYRSENAPALRDINLSVFKGEFLGITGPTGAGKSTLAKCLNGIIPHFQRGLMHGLIKLKDESINNSSIATIARTVGSVFDDPEGQIVSMEVEQELIFGLENMGIPPENMKQRMDKALEVTGIAHLRHSPTNSLSGGQKQRLAIAAVLAMQPEVLILDEPTSELDPMGSKEIFQVLRYLNKQEGITVVMIEQKTELLARYADRIVVLEQGEIAMEGTPERIFSRREELYKIGVQVPQVTELACLLTGETDILPLTVPEGASFIRERFRGTFK
ncbi:MAG: ATP-binding cassette domain-containing protein [Firmicutes bacterium]|nr:ATP-binding cassette domain-containing protein [Bacillota bacterium]